MKKLLLASIASLPLLFGACSLGESEPTHPAYYGENVYMASYTQNLISRDAGNIAFRFNTLLAEFKKQNAANPAIVSLDDVKIKVEIKKDSETTIKEYVYKDYLFGGVKITDKGSGVWELFINEGKYVSSSMSEMELGFNDYFPRYGKVTIDTQGLLLKELTTTPGSVWTMTTPDGDDAYMIGVMSYTYKAAMGEPTTITSDVEGWWDVKGAATTKSSRSSYTTASDWKYSYTLEQDGGLGETGEIEQDYEHAFAAKYIYVSMNGEGTPVDDIVKVSYYGSSLQVRPLINGWAFFGGVEDVNIIDKLDPIFISNRVRLTWKESSSDKNKNARTMSYGGYVIDENGTISGGPIPK